MNPSADFDMEWKPFMRDAARRYGWRCALDYAALVLRNVTTPEWFIATCGEWMPGRQRRIMWRP